MTPAQIQALQAQLGVPQTGVMDAATTGAYNTAVSAYTAADPNVQQYGVNNETDDIVNAYNTGDWSGVTSLSGQPFSDAQQQSAVQSASNELAPSYNAQQAYDTANTEQDLQKNQQDLENYNQQQNQQFAQDKNSADTNAAANGVLYAGSRVQQNNDLRNSYNLASNVENQKAGQAAGTDLRDYANTYGSGAASNLASMYSLPGANTYNANTASRQPNSVSPTGTLSSYYNPSAYNYQGTAPVAQSAAVQTRAAGLLANQANKLTLNNYSNSL